MTFSTFLPRMNKKIIIPKISTKQEQKNHSE